MRYKRRYLLLATISGLFSIFLYDESEAYGGYFPCVMMSIATFISIVSLFVDKRPRYREVKTNTIIYFKNSKDENSIKKISKKSNFKKSDKLKYISHTKPDNWRGRSEVEEPAASDGDGGQCGSGTSSLDDGDKEPVL